MSPTIEQIAALPVPTLRAALPTWVSTHCVAPDDVVEGLRLALEAHMASASDESLTALLGQFAVAGDEYRMYPALPFARDMTRIYMGTLVPQWTIDGREHLDAFLASPARRRLIVCNHLSYTDTQISDVVLHEAGLTDVADRLVAIAGPKVYTDAWRRLAAISLNTRKTAQSSAVATEQGSLSPRELASVAIETLRDCERLMDEGYIVLLYPEGTRSRRGQLQPFLRAAGRYLQIDGLHVLPMGQTGSERVFPIDDPLMYPNPVRVAFGPAFEGAQYPGKTGALAEAHHRLVDVLPDAYRPDAGTPAVT